MPRLLHHISVRYPVRQLNRKLCPIIWLDSGTQFPKGACLGNCDPFWTQIPGRSFRDAQSTYALATPAHKKRGKVRVLPSLLAIGSRSPTSGAG